MSRICLCYVKVSWRNSIYYLRAWGHRLMEKELKDFHFTPFFLSYPYLRISVPTKQPPNPQVSKLIDANF